MNDKEKLREREFDESWKKVLENYFWDFLTFYFPEIAKQVDQTREYSFLDSELSKVSRESKNIHKRLDKLAQVYLKEKEELWLLIHVEVQTYRDTEFALRMFTYHYRVFDLYKKPIVSLAILADPHKDFRPTSFQTQVLGKTFVDFQFLISKLLDWTSKEKQLEKEQNPFAIVTLASLKTYEENTKKRYNFKYNFTKMLYQRGYNKEKIIALYEFLDGIMVLPKEMELQYNQKIIEYEEECKMPYVTTAEKIGIEKGTQKCILDLLETRFNKVSQEISSQINSITDLEHLRSLHKQAINIASIEEFAKLLKP